MSTAIFLAPRGNGGGYAIELGEDVHTRQPEGFHNLIVIGKHGQTTDVPLREGDWVELRDCVNQMPNNR